MIWVPIRLPGIDHYEVNALGQVRNGRTGKLLKPWRGWGMRGRYYKKVYLYNLGERRAYFVHRLVAFAFWEIDHINKDMSDNRLENLEPVLPQENLSRRW